ncbi:MAG TPA: PLP-dependent aminotransferase family protein [Clostridia bacterium]|nr:PLP-dependent aminotransferase family protein [Clostridia bacterium]
MDYVFSNRTNGMKPSAIREIVKYFEGTKCIQFADGNPSAESFPIDAIHKISEHIISDHAAEVFQYGVSEGYKPLRETIKKRMEKCNCVRDFDEIVITSGSQQAIDLSSRTFLNEGDTVICDNPSYMGALNNFQSYNINLVGIEMEKDGMNIAMLEKSLKEEKNVKLIYVVPTFQNPTGISISLEKRKAIYELAKKYGVIIIEDNPYGDLRYKGQDIPPIKSLDTEGIVIYCGSFSKVLCAGIRIGYALAPASIIDKIVIGKQVDDVHTGSFFQVLAEHYMNQYDFDAHIDSIRELYRHKLSIMTSCLNEKMKECVYQEPEGGLFLWCDLPKWVNSMAYCKQAGENGVAVVPGLTFTIDENPNCNAIRLNFSTPSDEQIEKGITILADTLNSFKK